MNYQRSQVSTLRERLAEPPERLILVTGPRQTGKTTLVRQALANIDLPKRYLAVDKLEAPRLPLVPEDGATAASAPRDAPLRAGQRDTQWLARVWEQARNDAERSPQGAVLALDEIQKIPDWSEAVKGLWDADRRDGRRLHVILLGSAPLLMLKGTSESLAGRFETIRVTHWSFDEMSSAFGFDVPHYVYFGGYPGAARWIEQPERWRAYILESLTEPTIERDIIALQRVDKPALLERLFELGVEYSGEILSYNKMLGQLTEAGNSTTLARYLNLLESAGMLAGLSRHSGSAQQSKRSSPKLLALNTALMAASSGRTFEEAQADRSFWGRLVETAVGAHLCNTAAPGQHVRYWRDEKGREVDFVLRAGPHLAAFEVKSGKHQQKHAGLEAFEAKHPDAALVPVGEGGDWPLDKFLSTPAGEWFNRR